MQRAKRGTEAIYRLGKRHPKQRKIGMKKEKKEKRNQNVKDEGKEEERKDNMKETQHSHTYIYMKRT